MFKPHRYQGLPLPRLFVLDTVFSRFIERIPVKPMALTFAPEARGRVAGGGATCSVAEPPVSDSENGRAPVGAPDQGEDSGAPAGAPFAKGSSSGGNGRRKSPMASGMGTHSA